MTTVWLNGAFGVGKSTTALLLDARDEVGPVALFDPEVVGMGLRHSLPPELRHGDFQDLPMWVDAVVGTLGWLAATAPDTTVVVPMTVLDPGRWSTITTGARERGVDLVTVWLGATPEALTERILGRPTELGDHEWCLRHRDQAATAERALPHDLVVPTDGLPPEQVVEAVVAHLVR